MAEDYFIIEHEGHISPHDDGEELKNYRDYQRFQNSLEGVMRIITADAAMAKEFMQTMSQRPAVPPPEPEASIARMDAAGIDVTCLVPHRHAVHMNVDPRGPSMSWMIDACEKYPDRLMMGPVFEPSTRGMESTLWEMEYLVKEKGCKYCKLYPPGELWDINDRRFWPFYAKAQELGLVMGMHMGHGYIYGANTHACRPGHLEDICREFYDLRILAFHFGWPWHHELNAYARLNPPPLFCQTSGRGHHVRRRGQGYLEQ
jgi:predicted TIM-barrel fold metal-dependent hydrolase